MLISLGYFDFYSSNLLRIELLRHKDKLLKLTGMPVSRLKELEELLLGNIQFIDESITPEKQLLSAEQLTFDIDKEDTPFVALTSYLDGLLWTGDRRLASGLHKKGFIQTITTTQLSAFYNELQHRSRIR